jgi:hypothetical protein
VTAAAKALQQMLAGGDHFRTPWRCDAPRRGSRWDHA